MTPDEARLKFVHEEYSEVIQGLTDKIAVLRTNHQIKINELQLQIDDLTRELREANQELSEFRLTQAERNENETSEE